MRKFIVTILLLSISATITMADVVDAGMGRWRVEILPGPLEPEFPKGGGFVRGKGAKAYLETEKGYRLNFSCARGGPFSVNMIAPEVIGSIRRGEYVIADISNGENANYLFYVSKGERSGDYENVLGNLNIDSYYQIKATFSRITSNIYLLIHNHGNTKVFVFTSKDAYGAFGELGKACGYE